MSPYEHNSQTEIKLQTDDLLKKPGPHNDVDLRKKIQ